MTRHQAGLAMIDVLIALLLLGIALTGTGVTLVQTMRSTQGALLSGRAIDLASDLAEELRLATTPAAARATLSIWQARVATILPVSGVAGEHATVAASSAQGHIDIVLRWRRDAGHIQELRVPIGADQPVARALLESAT